MKIQIVPHNFKEGEKFKLYICLVDYAEAINIAEILQKR